MGSTNKEIIEKVASRLMEPIDRWANKSFYDFPFGKAPKGTASSYMEIWNKTKQLKYATIDEFEEKLGYSINDTWLNDLALQTQVIIKKLDICYQHGRLLYSVLSFYISQNSNLKNINIIETGTARGFSCLCMAKALSDAEKQGKIITFDIIPHDTKMYWNCIADLTGPKSRSELLTKYSQLIDEYIIFIQGDSKYQLKKVSMPRVHFAFLDGKHSYEYILNEFKFLKDRQEKGDIIFFDDYTPKFYPGIVKAVDEICEKYSYSKEVIFLNDQR
ncbi:MAG: hypothetical protein JWQ25_334, partial [Daejeonella sp.]|nr:hypothetical protein [Daejeonella sp.]